MQKPNAKQTLAWLIFRGVTAWPKTLIVLGLLLIISCASFIPGLVKDTRSDAFLPDDEPALIYRDKVKAIFGLTDPMVVAVVNEGPQGIFNPDTLKLVDWLTQEISRLNNVDPDRVTSLATENNITGNKEGMLVEPFWDELPDTQQQADSIRSAIMNFPLYQGSLVAEDGTGTLIIAELIDQTKA
ncbi:MAG: Patched family protein, partial [Candidatus Thiodiazotropha sp. (ex Lucinoma borealis)]|nr:Patched family protein [Candidatus Thiodiazotropha sp. (ex Lucinoma borealis)]